MKLNSKLLLLVTASISCVVGDKSCVKMSSLYQNGKELCERMWSNSFRYVDVNDPEYEYAYTMWFFTQNNPNDMVTSDRRAHQQYSQNHDADYNTTECHLQYRHKTYPSPEPDTFTECHPWKNNSCCHTESVSSAKEMNVAYGEEYRWDRCGSLTPECERFFVQEECFYQCDPNAGLFRKYHPFTYNASDDSHNRWQMSNMPIKGDYCDAWYTACSGENYFCGAASFFECANLYEHPTPEQQVESNVSEIVIVVLVMIAFVCLVCIIILIYKEKKGTPAFIHYEDSGNI